MAKAKSVSSPKKPKRGPPFTQAGLEKWLDEALRESDVSEFISAERQRATVTPESYPASGDGA